MLLRPLAALSFLGLLMGGSPVLAAPPTVAPPAQVKPGETLDAKTWLMRIHEAASRRNFQGTFVVSGGGSVSSARIAHFTDGNDQFERIETLDGQPRQVFRHNGVVQTLWPASRVVVVEQRQAAMGSFPALLQGADSSLAAYYELRSEGPGRVAGYEADVLLVKPKDNLRYGWKLWAERLSGLLLRADVTGERGEVLETSAFSDVSIGVKSQPELVLQPMRRLDGLRVVKPVLTPTQLDAEGWLLREPATGFREVHCVRRPMQAGRSGDADAPTDPVVQAIYSDGLTYVSLFIERFDAARHPKEMMAAVGATHTLMRRNGDWWITVVGDVPMRTLKSFANALERKK